jgi:hypothetical protein
MGECFGIEIGVDLQRVKHGSSQRAPMNNQAINTLSSSSEDTIQRASIAAVLREPGSEDTMAVLEEPGAVSSSNPLLPNNALLNNQGSRRHMP